MRTNIEIDEKLLAKAMKYSGAKTKKATVHAVLQWLVDTREASAAFFKQLRAKERAEKKSKRMTRQVK